MLRFSRVISFALSILILATTLLGCQTDVGGSKIIYETEAPHTATQEYIDSLTGVGRIMYERSLVRDGVPRLDFDGETFAVIIPEGSIDDWRPEEMSSDQLSSALYETCEYVEERLGVKLIFSDEASDEEVDDLISTGDDTYSVVVKSYNKIGQLAMENRLRDWETIPYMNLDAAWWNQSAREAVSVLGRTYMMVGASCVQEVRVTYCVYYNKTLAEQYKSVLPNLYDLVYKGQWTLDKFIEVSRVGYRDLNGNTRKDPNDQFGLAGQTTSYAVPFLYSCGEMTTQRDSDGIPYIHMNTEKVVSIVEKVYSLIYEDKATWPTRDWSTHSDIFADGRALFMYGTFAHALSGYFDEMEDVYGFLPYPKYDELQKDYHTITDPSGSTFGILLHCPNDEVLGAVMEVMNARAWQQVQPALYDAALKGRSADAPEDGDMLDIINRGVVYDFGYVYGGPGELLSKMMNHKTKDYASQYAQRIRGWENNINTAVDAIINSEW